MFGKKSGILVWPIAQPRKNNHFDYLNVCIVHYTRLVVFHDQYFGNCGFFLSKNPEDGLIVNAKCVLAIQIDLPNMWLANYFECPF